TIVVNLQGYSTVIYCFLDIQHITVNRKVLRVFQHLPLQMFVITVFNCKLVHQELVD
ncbi:hypothetical protein UPYG_G00043680, partial [Umbra pygmaea]